MSNQKENLTKSSSSEVYHKHSPWLWVPSLYFAEGLPYAIVLLQSIAMYSMLNLSNTEIAFYTGWLYLPWVIKPIWGPLVDVFFRKRACIISMQLFIGGACAGVALLLPTSWQIQGTLALFWLIAFASATHDIAADGMYMLGLDEGNQSLFVGSRSLFYRLAMLFGQGGVFLFVGLLSQHLDVAVSWSIAFLFLAAFIIALAFYHFKMLPKLEVLNKKRPSIESVLFETFHVFRLFFYRKDIWLIVGFIFLFRLGESQLTKLIIPFLINGSEVGGLALSAATSASLYGLVGVFALLIGGILGGVLIAKHGLKRWIIPMVLILNIPDLLYLFLAWTQTD
ncbi:MAG: MFS transporter, partial [Bacteroidaceae bacterium]